jgi:hypothetical protein
MRVVKNWRSGWKWISSWTHVFVFLCGAAWTIIPPPLLARFTHRDFAIIIMTLALAGFLGRFIDQERKK